MLLRFTVGNFRSFSQEMTLDLIASNGLRDNIDGAFTNVEKYKILNSIAFYGANSSGKTNFLRAIGTMRSIIVHSVRLNDNESLPYDPFLLTTGEKHPTKFEAVLYNIPERATYTYGFEYNQTTISKEWLYAKFPRKASKTLFERNGERYISDQINFVEGQNITVKLNNNRLLLSLVGQLGGRISNIIINLFQRELHVLSGIADSDYSNYTRHLVHDNIEYRNFAQNFLKDMNLGFSEFTTKSIEFEKVGFPQGLPAELIAHFKGQSFIEVSSVHALYNEQGVAVGTINLDLDENESAGTNKIFNLTGPILEALNFGRILIIDELDSQMHPLISWKLIQYFNDPKKNLHGAQLIFSTHDTHLLSNKLFRRDQIWLVEKDSTESSVLYPMMKATDKLGHTPRSDSNYQKNYINGMYGAIPYMVNEAFDE